MTSVIKKLYGGEQRGTRNRPDFAITPDSTAGFYARPSYDAECNEVGTGELVIVELKKPGVRIGADEKGQVWKYVTELMEALGTSPSRRTSSAGFSVIQSGPRRHGSERRATASPSGRCSTAPSSDRPRSG
jgi:hypothetical protein